MSQQLNNDRMALILLSVLICVHAARADEQQPQHQQLQQADTGIRNSDGNLLLETPGAGKSVRATSDMEIDGNLTVAGRTLSNIIADEVAKQLLAHQQQQPPPLLAPNLFQNGYFVESEIDNEHGFAAAHSYKLDSDGNIVFASECIEGRTPFQATGSCNCEGPTASDESKTSISIEFVHPFTTCFEGPWVAVQPADAATTCAEATETQPYWFGPFNMGPRSVRSGLSGGWESSKDGQLMKITVTNQPPMHISTSGSCLEGTFVSIPNKIQRTFLNRDENTYLFRAWIKIVKGDRVTIGEEGLMNCKGLKNSRCNSYTITTKKDTDMAQDGWKFVNVEVSSQDATGISSRNFGRKLSITADENGDAEVYIALPYLALVMSGSAWIE